MANLQELITRGRLIFSNASKRLEVFKLINGKRSTKEIAIKVGRGLSSVLQDIEKMKDMGLIKGKENKEGDIFKKERAIVYEKIPLIKHVSLSYFQDVAKTNKFLKGETIKKKPSIKQTQIHVPLEMEILDICKHGEDQLYEFKRPGTESAKIAKEIAAFVHTKMGGILFYGIDDDGSIIGSNTNRQLFDQKIQNSTRNTISPQPNIAIKERNVLGSKVIMIICPPWDRRTFYQYTKDGRYYIRKGNNVFALQPNEISKLGRGEYIV